MATEGQPVPIGETISKLTTQVGAVRGGAELNIPAFLKDVSSIGEAGFGEHPKFKPVLGRMGEIFGDHLGANLSFITALVGPNMEPDLIAEVRSYFNAYKLLGVYDRFGNIFQFLEDNINKQAAIQRLGNETQAPAAQPQAERTNRLASEIDPALRQQWAGLLGDEAWADPNAKARVDQALAEATGSARPAQSGHAQSVPTSEPVTQPESVRSSDELVQQQEDPGETIRKLNTIYEQGDVDSTAEGYRQLLRVHADMGRELIEPLAKMVEENPNHGNLRKALGDAYMSSGRFQKAIEEYNRAAAVKPASGQTIPARPEPEPQPIPQQELPDWLRPAAPAEAEKVNDFGVPEVEPPKPPEGLSEEQLADFYKQEHLAALAAGKKFLSEHSAEEIKADKALRSAYHRLGGRRYATQYYRQPNQAVEALAGIDPALREAVLPEAVKGIGEDRLLSFRTDVLRNVNSLLERVRLAHIIDSEIEKRKNLVSTPELQEVPDFPVAGEQLDESGTSERIQLTDEQRVKLQSTLNQLDQMGRRLSEMSAEAKGPEQQRSGLSPANEGLEVIDRTPAIEKYTQGAYDASGGLDKLIAQQDERIRGLQHSDPNREKTVSSWDTSGLERVSRPLVSQKQPLRRPPPPPTAGAELSTNIRPVRVRPQAEQVSQDPVERAFNQVDAGVKAINRDISGSRQARLYDVVVDGIKNVGGNNPERLEQLFDRILKLDTKGLQELMVSAYSKLPHDLYNALYEAVPSQVSASAPEPFEDV